MCSGVATTAINPFWIVCDYLALGVCMTSVTVSDYGELTLFGLFVIQCGGEVTEPVYDCGQGNCPLVQVPGVFAGRSEAPNFPIGFVFPLSPRRLRASSASLLV